MSSTVQAGKMEITSTDSPEVMLEALKPPKETDDKPRVLVDRGQKVKADEQPSKTSEAARELGKLGGRAAAEARKAAVDEQEKRAERQMAKDAGVEDEEEAKPKEAKAEAEKPAEGEGEEKPANPRHDAKARIQQLARERREAEDRARALEERLAKLEAAQKPAEQPRKADPAADGRPHPSQYEDYEQYVEALAEWKADRRIEAKLQEVAQKREADEAAQGVVKRIQGFREKAAAPDLADRIDPELGELRPASLVPPGERITQGNVLAEEFLQSDHPAELMLYLTEHPEEKARLLNAPDVRTIQRGVALIEAKLAKGEPPARQTSKAPPPIQPIMPSSVPGNPDLTRAGSFDEYARLRGGR